MVSAIDDAVKDIKTSLETSGLMGDTVIVFASDNGGNSKVSKATMYLVKIIKLLDY